MQDYPSAYFSCLQEEDNIDHILVQCPFARQVWMVCLQAAGLVIQEPNTDSPGKIGGYRQGVGCRLRIGGNVIPW
jgi:hypothetical protein